MVVPLDAFLFWQSSGELRNTLRPSTLRRGSSHCCTRGRTEAVRQSIRKRNDDRLVASGCYRIIHSYLRIPIDISRYRSLSQSEIVSGIARSQQLRLRHCEEIE